MSNLFGGGSKGGNSNPFQGLVNPTQGISIPYFTSQGGITPEQQSYVDYTTDQQRLAERGQYGGEGLGASTMATQGAEGAATGGAELAGTTSDVNTGARYDQYKNQVTNFEEGLANQTTLDQIAQQAQDQNAMQTAAQDAQNAQALGKFITSGLGTFGKTSSTPSTSTT